MTEFEYWHLGITIGMTAAFCIIFIIIHSHVWTRGGYEGVNKQLEDHEVDKFIAHVLSESSFIALFLIAMLETPHCVTSTVSIHAGNENYFRVHFCWFRCLGGFFR